MIRIVSIATMLVFLAVLFYLPSVYPPSAFLDRVRVEHEAVSEYWGEEHAARALSRAMDLHGGAKSEVPVATAYQENTGAGSAGSDAARRLSDASRRLFDNEYTRSISALLALFFFRLSSLLELLPLGGAFLLACIVDGLVVRQVKSREFRSHSPELFATHAAMVVLLVCGCLVAFLLPLMWNPLVMSVPFLLAGVFVNQAVANFHSKG